MNHDIVAIGGSAGCLEVLLDAVKELPEDLAAAVFVVIHSSPGYPSKVAELLSKRGPLPARYPFHDEPIKQSTIYVAPPDVHLVLRPGAVEVVRGPRDNGHRPAADVL